jgi:Domain of unknown function (DUF4129)
MSRVRPLCVGLALTPFFAPSLGVAIDPATRDRANGRAEQILGERRFQDPDLPTPLRDPIQWIGERIRDAGEFLFGWAELPGGAVWLLLGAAVVLIAAIVALRLARRRAEVEAVPGLRAAAAAFLSPDDLDRDADIAERRGDLAGAVRLRFRAGLLRLATDGVIPRATAVTNREVARRAGSPTFPRVARSFEEIVYGRRTAVEADVHLARDGWPAIRREVAPRTKDGA